MLQRSRDLLHVLYHDSSLLVWPRDIVVLLVNYCVESSLMVFGGWNPGGWSSYRTWIISPCAWLRDSTTSWQPLQSMSSERVGAAVTLNDNELIASGGYLGGKPLSGTSVFSFSQMQWREETWPAPYSRGPRIVYVAGVHLGVKINCPYSSEETVDVKILNPITKEWINPSTVTGVGGVRNVRKAMAIVGWNNLLVCIGGDYGFCSVQGRITSEVNTYNLVTNSWQTFPSLCKSRRYGTAVVTPDGGILLLGGEDDQYDGHNMLNSVEYYDPRLERWSIETDIVLPIPINHLDAYIVDNLLVIACRGEKLPCRSPDEVKHLQGFWVLDWMNRSACAWHKLPQLPINTHLFSSAIVPL